MKRFVICLGAAWCACGGGTATGPAADAGVQNTVRGQPIGSSQTISTALAQPQAVPNSEGLVVITGEPAVCAAQARGKVPANLTALVIELVQIGPSGVFAPRGPGTFKVGDFLIGRDAARVAFVVLDSSCHHVATREASAVSGTVTVTAFDQGAYSGNFDVTMDSGDHLSGAFAAAACNSISVLFFPPAEQLSCE